MTRRIDIKYLIAGLFIITGCSFSYGQEIKVKSGFFADSVGIGLETKYYLTASYPRTWNVLFPDSTFNFTPFEFEGKKYVATHTVNDISYDSVIYSLSTFEVDSLQMLSLPVYIVSDKDSIEVRSNLDTILLAQLVGPIPDSLSVDRLPLRMNTTYQEVPTLFNYPVLLIVLGILLVVALVVVFVFGKKIRRYYRMKKLKKNHAKFIEAYTSQIDQVKTSFSSSTAELTLATWKKYMEQLESRPYTKLTTRETLKLEKDEQLGNNLHTIDKAIYGHAASVVEPLEKLRDYAGTKFLKKLEEVKHG